MALAAWIYMVFVLPFRAAAAGRNPLSLRVQGYESGDVLDMLQFLRSHPDAAAIQHGLDTGPALVFAVASTALLFLLLKLVKPGGIFFGRPIPPAGVTLLFSLPILYGLVACGETILAILVFPPALPSEQSLAFAAVVMPVLGRLKFLTLVVAIILLIRFAVLSRQPELD
ncbi:hypothetical protein [Rhizobium tumorigenes]|uniref:Uncharacterized protein n=1 Tax=Rhizobium tumorigenes TaxID=2041385 RepID=A0AAF1K8C7_9HYPH|nr:hypothetical protein [Rhizobium tumorigenes]WFR95884.1 hypothetical protein PR017_01665 [Rhizobium tumorigenes]